MRRVDAVLTVAALLVVMGTASSVARAAGRAPAATQGSAPATAAAKGDTVQEHEAQAAAYREKAQAFHKEADEHRKMLADYKASQSTPALETKLGQEPPWVKQMRKHCEGYISAAEKLAAEAERFAEFHKMRAEELRQK